MDRRAVIVGCFSHGPHVKATAQDRHMGRSAYVREREGVISGNGPR